MTLVLGGTGLGSPVAERVNALVDYPRARREQLRPEDVGLGRRLAAAGVGPTSCGASTAGRDQR